jgi:hypothetical protein
MERRRWVWGCQTPLPVCVLLLAESNRSRVQSRRVESGRVACRVALLIVLWVHMHMQRHRDCRERIRRTRHIVHVHWRAMLPQLWRHCRRSGTQRVGVMLHRPAAARCRRDACGHEVASIWEHLGLNAHIRIVLHRQCVVTERRCCDTCYAATAAGLPPEQAPKPSSWRILHACRLHGHGNGVGSRGNMLHHAAAAWSGRPGVAAGEGNARGSMAVCDAAAGGAARRDADLV